MLVDSQTQTATRDVVRPSVLPEGMDPGFTLDQELSLFGRWCSDTLWVPAKDSSEWMAETLLEKHTPRSSKTAMWKTIRQSHAETFTQVRQIEMAHASIRLPKAKLFVQVIPQDQFDTITDPIPRCVQTRLDEFLDGPAQKLEAKVYYLKPLCVEVGSDLIFTEEDEIRRAIQDIQQEAFAEFRHQYWRRTPARLLAGLINAVLWLPR